MSKRIKLALGGILLLVFILTVGSQAWALPVDYELEVPIGDTYRVSGMAQYIDVLYKFLIGAAGVIATVMIMYGGWMWIFAAGSEGTITAAKERITSALIGLALALASYLILFTVNPALVQLITISPTEISPLSACLEGEPQHTKGSQVSCTKNCQCGLSYIDLGGNNIYMECTFRGVDALDSSDGTKQCAIRDDYECAKGIINNSVTINGVTIEPVSFKIVGPMDNDCLSGSKCVSGNSDVIIKDDTTEVSWRCRETSDNGLVSIDGNSYCIYPQMLDPNVNYRCGLFNDYAQTR